MSETNEAPPPAPDPEPTSKLDKLRWAAEDGDMDVLGALLTRRNANYCDATGVTLLAIAAAGGRAAAVMSLLEHGARADVSDRDGFRALHRAVWGGHLEVVEMLVNAGASLYDKGSGKAGTVLGLACQRNQFEIVEYLLGAKADIIDLVDQCGHTALARAAAAGNTDMVQLLLSRGADRALSNPREICQKRAALATTQSNKLRYQNLVSMIAQHQAPQSCASVS